MILSSLAQSIARPIASSVSKPSVSAGGDEGAIILPSADTAYQAMAYESSWLSGSTVLDQRTGVGTARPQQPGRAYDFDGTDDLLRWTTADIGTLYVSYFSVTGDSWVDTTIANIAGDYDFEPANIVISNVKIWTDNTASTAQKQATSFDSIPANLWFWGKCDDTHATTAYDSSGNANHGTKTGTTASFHYEGADVPYSWQNEVGYSDSVNGPVPRDESDQTIDVLGSTLDYTGVVPKNGELIDSNCLTFDGTDDYISVPDSAAISPATMTVSCWVKLNVIANSGIVTKRTTFNSGIAFSLLIDTSNNFEFVASAAGTFPTAAAQISAAGYAGQWVHLAGTADGSDAKLYLNGVEAATVPFAFDVFDSAADLKIGAVNGTAAGFFDGNMFDVRFYNKALTPDEITHVYTQGASGTDPGTDNLQLHYPFAEGDGATVYDTSGNGNHQTIVGGQASNWTTLQSVYHANITNGFSEVAGANVPAVDATTDAQGNTLTNPAVVGHNGAETKLNFVVEPDAVWTNGLTLETDYEFGDGRTAPNYVTQEARREHKFYTEKA